MCAAVIQAIWTPRICMVERRVNIHKLNDRRTPVTDKVLTFEGSWKNTQEGESVEQALESARIASHHFLHFVVLCSPVVTERVQSVCDSVVRHIADVRHKHVSRMVLKFKIDARDTLWLMECTCMRFFSKARALRLFSFFLVCI